MTLASSPPITNLRSNEDDGVPGISGSKLPVLACSYRNTRFFPKRGSSGKTISISGGIATQHTDKSIRHLCPVSPFGRAL